MIDTTRCLIWVIAGGLTVALGCGKEEVPPPAEPVPLPVKMFTVGQGSSLGTIEYPGRTSAWLHSEMAFEVGGRIIAFNVVEGQRVTKGTKMVSLDPRDYVAEVQKANATLAQSSADFQRYQKLFDEGVTSQADLDARRKRYEVSKADLDRAKKAREDADLIAPFSGVVARKLVDDFQNVRRKEPVLILQDVSRLKFTTALPEADLTSRNARPTREEINARIDAHVIVSSLPDLSFDATLGELALTADPTTRTFDATFYFKPPDDVNVLPGMTAKVVVSFDAGGSGDYQVPGTAVFADDEGGSNVWRVDMERNVVERVPVSIGAMSGDRITIQGGLAAGDVIAFSGVHELEDGRLVREYVR